MAESGDQAGSMQVQAVDCVLLTASDMCSTQLMYAAISYSLWNT